MKMLATLMALTAFSLTPAFADNHGSHNDVKKDAKKVEETSQEADKYKKKLVEKGAKEIPAVDPNELNTTNEKKN